MKKERIFYLDFIRAVATISIILTHYNALFIYNTSTPMPQKAVITLTVGNVYIGGWGVSLFLIISGASLMYVYENKIQTVEFWKKRFINIYPMFWIAYLGAMLFNFYQYGSIDTSIGKWKYIFSILGIDSYLGNFGVSSFYLVGEWFLGYILIIYLVFPLLRRLVIEHPIALGVCVGIIYIASTIYVKKNVTLFARLPEFLFGMYFIYYGKKVNWKMALGAFLIVLLNGLIKPEIYTNFQSTYVGISSFVLLVYCADFFTVTWIKNICKIICKYSYPCFIVHHFIIYKVTAKFNLDAISVGQSYLLFGCCCVIIAVFSYLLFHLYDKIMLLFKGDQ